MKQWTRIIALKKKKAGYSNNPNYFGDWFGEGQIDFSKIINQNDSGDVYMVKIWGGSGYILDVYLVKADSEEDAIDKVFEWSYNNEGKNKIIFDYKKLHKDCKEDYESDYANDPDPMNYDDFEDEWMSTWISNSDYTLFARDENFFVAKVPQEYLNKKQSSLKKKKAAINFMTILNPTYWPLIGDKAKQFHVGDTIKLSIPSSFGPDESGGGNIPEDIVKLRNNKNGTNGKIISIDQVEGIPGSDAEAMTIQLDSGERLDKFPAAWVVKASLKRKASQIIL